MISLIETLPVVPTPQSKAHTLDPGAQIPCWPDPQCASRPPGPLTSCHPGSLLSWVLRNLSLQLPHPHPTLAGGPLLVIPVSV